MSDAAGSFTIWVVYDHPRDYPHFYVARRFVVLPGRTEPTSDVMQSGTLDNIRQELHKRGLHAIGRHCSDDPKIVETWI